ncbi:hypothetical protein [Gordonia sp. GN26]
MSTREPLLTVFIRPADERRVIESVAERFPQVPPIAFADADDEPSLREQWTHEHPGVEPGDRRYRHVVADTTVMGPTRLTEMVVDVISPHARTEAAQTPPFAATPDEFPWTAHTELWSGRSEFADDDRGQ